MHEFFNKIKDNLFKYDNNFDKFYGYIWNYLYKEKKTKIKDNFTIICNKYTEYVTGVLTIKEIMIENVIENVIENIIINNDEELSSSDDD